MSEKSDQPINYLSRQGRLWKIIRAADLHGIALNPGPSLVYLTGLHFHLSERPVVAIFLPDTPVFLALPQLELRKIASLSFPLQSFAYGDNPQTWHETFIQVTRAAGLNGAKIGVEPERLRFLELRLLQDAAPQTQFISAYESLAALRIQKDAREISAMRRAVEIAQQAFLATLPTIKPGTSERQIASELTLQLLRSGSAAEMPFSPIVSSGPNSVNPHAVPSERILTPGDLLIIDWGAAYDGYLSDLTRTLAIGKVDAEYERIAQIVLEANIAGRALLRPGIQAGEVDQAARQVITKAGYGSYFTHRVGHGLGMELHEEPYMFGENSLILKPGMSFTVEPGIYLPERGGVRIEDNVVITDTGAECLSSLPRELFRIEA